MFELKLNLNQVNAVLTALGQMKYVEVADLINTIKSQAEPQLERVQAELQEQQAQTEAA